MRFLSDNELEMLTGYKRPTRQSKWLRDNGWAFEINGAGHPIVSESHCEHRLNLRDFSRSTLPKKHVPNVCNIR